MKPGGTFLICNEVNGDTDKDKKWTEIIDGMTIYKDTELKAYLEQAGFCDIAVHKSKTGWLCLTAVKRSDCGCGIFACFASVMMALTKQKVPNFRQCLQKPKKSKPTS